MYSILKGILFWEPKISWNSFFLGLPGDEVAYNKKFTQIPNGQMWLEGDKKTESWDSRDYGPVPIGLMEGVVFFKLSSLSRIRNQQLLQEE